MGLFPKKKKDSYGEYSDKFWDENYTLSDEGIIPIGRRQDINQAPYALTPDEVKGNTNAESVEDIPMHSAGESLYKRMIDARSDEKKRVEKRSEKVKEQAESLLEKCSQFVTDDKKNHSFVPEPAYTLDSVESIIAEAEKRAQTRVKKIYGGEGDTACAKHAEQAKSENAEQSCEKNDISARRQEIPEKTSPVQIKLPDEKEKSALPSAGAPLSYTTPSEGITLPKPHNDSTEHGGDDVKECVSTAEAPEQTPEEITMERGDVRSYHYRFADEDIEGALKMSEASETEDEKTAEDGTIQFIPVTEKKPPFSAEIKDSLQAETESADDEDIPDAEDELFLDYHSFEDAKPVFAFLSKKQKFLRIRLAITLLFAAFAVFALLPFADALRELNPLGFLTAETVALAVCAVINLDIFKSLTGVLSGKADADLPLAVSTIGCLAFGIYSIAAGRYELAQFGSVAIIGMVFSLCAKRSSAKNMIKNFAVVANEEQKFALTLVDEENDSCAIAHGAVEGEALIAIGKKTANASGFLKHSLTPDRFKNKAVPLTAVGVIAAAIMLVYGAVTADISEAFLLFTAMLCTTAPYTSKAIGSFPLSLAAKRLSRNGAMLAGYGDAEKIEQANAVVFDVGSLFPRGRVKMYDLKVLSPNDLEKTIFNAAAVTTSANSPLGHVFRRIARTSDDYVLPPADSVKYENRLGISGWVGDHSLLIGNRTLMETHGVSVPSVEVDKKILRNGYFPVYVASDGRPCALLIVRYESDDAITEQLRRLCSLGVTILVDNCDPNVTEEMLCDYFGLPEGFVAIMQSGSVKKYREKSEFCETVETGAAFDGSAKGLAAIVAASIKIKQLTAAMTAVHILCLIAGIASAAVLFASGFGSLITPLSVTLYLLISAFLVRGCSLFFRP